MAHINIYSKSLCVQCEGTLRTINKAIEDGVLDPAQVTVHMIDGTTPRAGKVDERIEVNLIEAVEDQDTLLQTFRAHPSTGTSFPVVFVMDSKDEDAAEISVFSGLNPNSIKAAIKTAADSAPALAASA